MRPNAVDQKRVPANAKTYMPAGNVSNVHMEKCLDELLMRLAAHFGKDWPNSFEQVSCCEESTVARSSLKE